MLSVLYNIFVFVEKERIDKEKAQQTNCLVIFSHYKIIPSTQKLKKQERFTLPHILQRAQSMVRWQMVEKQGTDSDGGTTHNFFVGLGFCSQVFLRNSWTFQCHCSSTLLLASFLSHHALPSGGHAARPPSPPSDMWAVAYLATHLCILHISKLGTMQKIQLCTFT